MKIILSLLAVLSCTLAMQAQQADSTVFRAYLYNEEYDVYMRINLYDQDIIISWQDIYGPLPGFLAKNDYNFCWMITDSKVSGRKAELEMVKCLTKENGRNCQLPLPSKKENKAKYLPCHRKVVPLHVKIVNSKSVNSKSQRC